MRELSVAFLMPVVITVITLAGVAWNRSAGREPIVLTERELYAPGISDDNSAARPTLTWQYGRSGRTWFTREKLTSLGFDTSVDPAARDASRHYWRQLPKRVWVVFELGGSAFEALTDEERARGSRLVPVDASWDGEALAAQYPDASRYLVTAAVVRASWMQLPGKPPVVGGTVESVLPRQIYVPREFAAVFGGASYKVSVRYGRRFEPWVVGASR